MINRTVAPPIYLADGLDFPKPNSIELPNGSKLLIINEGDVDVCRVDIVFNAGSRYQQRKLVAMSTMSLMPEGTASKSSQEISEYFDYWGSFIGISADKDYAKATAYSLTKYLPQTLQMLEQVIKEPSFPQAELDVWKRRGKQTLTVEMDKASTLARMEFFKTLFGQEHPYGAFAIPTDYDDLERNELENYHRNFIGSQGATIILSGKLSDSNIETLIKHFGEEQWGTSSSNGSFSPSSGETDKRQVFSIKQGALQSAIRVGRELFNRSHPDYPDLAVVNTILGGYFGSRLMKNIREDKGFTYGIGSYLLTFRDSGAFIISTEVGAGYTKQTLQEIRNELQRLTTEPVPEDELNRVRSYLMGEALRSLNGPFAIADNIMSLHNFNNLDYDFYQRLMSSIKNITPKRIMEIATKWLNPDLLVECVAGADNPF
jgi:predicted Zn-dependent peptidase